MYLYLEERAKLRTCCVGKEEKQYALFRQPLTLLVQVKLAGYPSEKSPFQGIVDKKFKGKFK